MSCGRRAGRFAIEDDSRQIDVLSGHDFGKPLASSKAGTLDIEDGDDGVTFEARLPDDPPSWAIDAERAIAAGLMTGLSPGFVVPPASAVPDAERFVPEPGNPGVQIRVISEAALREFSIVTAPAYADAAVDLLGPSTSAGSQCSGGGACGCDAHERRTVRGRRRRLDDGDPAYSPWRLSW